MKKSHTVVDRRSDTSRRWKVAASTRLSLRSSSIRIIVIVLSVFGSISKPEGQMATTWLRRWRKTRPRKAGERGRLPTRNFSELLLFSSFEKAETKSWHFYSAVSCDIRLLKLLWCQAHNSRSGTSANQVRLRTRFERFFGKFRNSVS